MVAPAHEIFTCVERIVCGEGDLTGEWSEGCSNLCKHTHIYIYTYIHMHICMYNYKSGLQIRPECVNLA